MKNFVSLQHLLSSNRKFRFRKYNFCHMYHNLRKFSTKMKIDATRNIGIIAHIDAGKTTTTERMLYYSGRTSTVGEVHDGNTVTDYMDQERERGITITSAAISFPWKQHVFNLIDTPGHIDFTIEVERSLRVIDGAVAIFDASAGVEAQSLTVWLQADGYSLPRLCFLNKMDKTSADLNMCLESIHRKLNTKTLLLQHPLGVGKQFHDEGKNYFSTPLTEEYNKSLWEECIHKRSTLIEDLADVDNEVAEVVLEKESTHLVPPDVLSRALKRVTLQKLAVPVFVGSAYKNIGVQPLMDAICKYLPSPSEKVFPGVELYGSSLCAVAFKIIHHKQKGLMTFIRVYSGTLLPGKRIFNASQNKNEKITNIYFPFADDYEQVSAAEAPSLSQQKTLDFALQQLLKEDPSLKLKYEEESGQNILAGMGELHLSIIKDRICKEYKVEAELGPLIISYRESLQEKLQHTINTNKTIGDVKNEVNVTLSLEPSDGYVFKGVEMAYTKENLDNLQSIRRHYMEALNRGIKSALVSGPLLRFPVINVKPKLHWLEVGRKTAETFVAAVAFQCIAEILKKGETYLLEPIMKVEVVVPEEKYSKVLADLSKRRADITSVEDRYDIKVIYAICPLAELVGFSSSIRAASSGLANFSLEFMFHRRMTEQECARTIASFSGFS
ncbi:Ribosome-releasing factor 2, mitochondrial [Armadillidium nasatum]|uniref:Ribosome-releasing factor 2, mitochondrial n=1 Tax=Armadillidium nasatum TaxID=96803 RepID=A0A5N5SNF0_9CRUS|nr:Ribosome-releasing factor 2, mitochondrial [Armadillidium nasatum]